MYTPEVKGKKRKYFFCELTCLHLINKRFVHKKLNEFAFDFKEIKPN